MTAPDPRLLVQQAIEGLRRGDPATARDRFQQVIGFPCPNFGCFMSDC